MKRIDCFCIPAHGHTNPMLPVAAELVRRGNAVRFFSFAEFREKIEATGAEFIPCDAYLPPLSEKAAQKLREVSATEMTVQDLQITAAMDGMIAEKYAVQKPDVIFSDSVCFWGKLNAWKYDIPLVVSTSTFAFNQLSSQYMHHSLKETADLMLGLPRISAELKKMQSLGYPKKGVLTLIQSDNQTDAVVYTSRRYQPYAESFSDHCLFVGPSIPPCEIPAHANKRPQIFISLGTVINDRPDFYKSCIASFRDMDADVVISCGKALDIASLGELPDNFRVYPYVNQTELLTETDLFITHCGMNSVSESLYMAVPMLFYPQTGEQQAVARRAGEIGAGVMLSDDSPDGIRKAAEQVLSDKAFAKAAKDCAADFRTCPGPAGAAEFIEQAPHSSKQPDPLAAFNKFCAKYHLLYWLIAVILMILTGIFIGKNRIWIVGMLAGFGFSFYSKAISGLCWKRWLQKQ